MRRFFITCTLMALNFTASGADAPVHGLWVWKTASVLKDDGSAERLRDFCKAGGINEVYVSASGKGALEDGKLLALNGVLREAGIRVEALFGNADGDKPGKPRDMLVERARAVVEFNRAHPAERFDGIHLDVEPHQREENKGADNLRFLPDLIETFRAVRAVAEPAGMTVNVDVAVKMLKADGAQRRAMLTSVDRVTLMLYEVSGPGDVRAAEKLRRASDRWLKMAYEGLDDQRLARMSIALRTPDYLEGLPGMLKSLDEWYGENPRYLGWARHSYNDVAGK